MSRARSWCVHTGRCALPDAPAPRDALPAHRDEPQVALDVRRSFVTFGAAPHTLDARRAQLAALIRGTLRRFPALHYYQGYHDLVAVLLLTVCPAVDDWEAHHATAQALVDQVSLFCVRDCMCADMMPALGHLRIVRHIVRAADPAYAAALDAALRPNTLLVALPWVLTLFTHSVDSLERAQAILDFVFARGPASTLYVAAAFILWHRAHGEVCDDGAELHAALAHAPVRAGRDDLDAVLAHAAALCERYPLKSPAVYAHTVMAPASALFTWDGEHSYAEIERILTLPPSSIVLDALPTPEEKPVRRVHRRRRIPRWLVFGRMRAPLMLLLLSAGVATLLVALYLGPRARHSTYRIK